jgi:hypothetical protein
MDFSCRTSRGGAFPSAEINAANRVAKIPSAAEWLAANHANEHESPNPVGGLGESDILPIRGEMLARSLGCGGLRQVNPPSSPKTKLLCPPHQEDMPGRMECRPQCGACCIAPSISSPIPGLPHGKPAGVRCVQLLPDYRCALYGQPERPAVCVHLRPMESMCGSRREEALAYLAALEEATRPLR